MKQRYAAVIAICVCFSLVFALAGQMVAQDKAAKPKFVRHEGRINTLNKTSSMITLQAKSGILQIKYTADTKYTYRNKPATIDDVKEGLRAIVLVDPTRKDQLVAARIDMREGK